MNGKLKTPSKQHEESIYFVSSKNDSTCSILIKKSRYRSLLDTGAECSLMRGDIYRQLKDNKTQLTTSPVTLRNASGKVIDTLGMATFTLKFGSEDLTQTFCISDHIKTSIILGQDFICKNNVYLKLGGNICEINGKQVPLIPQEEITSFVRMAESVQIPPQHVFTCYSKYHQNLEVKDNQNLELSQVTTGFLRDEPGLVVLNTIVQSNHLRRVPITFMNFTGRHYSLNKGNIIATVTELSRETELTEIIAEEHSPNFEDDVIINNINTTSKQDFDKAREEDLKKIIAVVNKNLDIFAKHEYDLGLSNLMEAHIDTGDAEPVRKKMYRTPFTHIPEMARQIKEMLKAKLIQPSNSSWSAPLFCIKKKDGSLRPIVDFRVINDVTKKFYWPLPNIDEVFASLGGCKYFSTLDFIKGYLQIPVAESSKPKTAFICEQSLFQSNVLTFGLCNAPSSFQQYMSILLNGCSEFATVYLDDIILYDSDIDSHCLHLQEVFNRIRKTNMKLSMSKCTFLRERVSYLGHILSKDGITPDPEKCKLIQTLERPRTVREIRSFVGMVPYYRRYIPHCAEMMEPLTSLIRKHAQLEWNKKREQRFQALKAALLSPIVLALPQINEQFQLYTDASDYAIGAVLTQTFEGHERPVYYLSHQLSKTQRAWPIIGKECYAIVFALEKFRVYLEGKRFPIYSDHNPLKYINSADNKNTKLQCWATKISAFGGKIHYLRGKDNVQADFFIKD